MLIEGVLSALRPLPNLEIVGVANSLGGAIEMLDACQPQIVVLLGAMEANSVSAAVQHVLKLKRDAKILALSCSNDSAELTETLATGGRGLLPMTATPLQLRNAILLIHSNSDCFVLPNPVPPQHPTKQFPDNRLSDNLTSREIQTLLGISSGQTSKEIAVALGVGVRTVESHRASLMNKLNLHSPASLTRYAIRNGYVTI